MVIEDTFNTLNFARKIKLVKTNAQKNVGNQLIHIDKFDSVIQNLKEQINIVKNEIKQQEQENNLIYNEEKKEIEDIVNYDNNEDKFNVILQGYINKISSHFMKEININKKINEIELKISNIKNENYFNGLNNKINKNDVKNEANELNDLQLTISSLYNKRYELTRKRRDIQVLISQETKKDNINKTNNFCIGPYLMYVYKYYITLINQLQFKNRKFKIDNDIIRKDNQIQILNNQIKLRDNILKDIKQKNGNNNISYNLKQLISIEELNLDPCVDINSIERNNNLEEFANNIISANNNQTMKRNISMPFLKSQANILRANKNKPKNNNNIALPIIMQKNNYFYKSKNSINDNSSSTLVKQRIPSGYLLRNHNSVLNNIKTNSMGQYKKYYNIYHISNNYHVGNFKAGNSEYNRHKIHNFKNKNNNSSLDFESDYNNKVKTLLKKNYIFRFNNSPYSLDNI